MPLTVHILMYVLFAALCAWALWRAYEDGKDWWALAVFGVLALLLPWHPTWSWLTKDLLLIGVFIILLKPGMVIKRLLWMIPTLLIISIVSFIIIKLPPGDFLTSYITSLQATGETVSMETVENLRVQYGLDQPAPAQYLQWMTGWAYADMPAKKLATPPPPKPGEVVKTTPLSSVTLTAKANGSKHVSLAWVPVTTTGKVAIERQGVTQNTSGTEWTRVATLDPLVANYEDTGLIASTAYRYRLVEVLPDMGGSLDTPTPPSNLSAEVSATTAKKAIQFRSKGFEWGPIKIGGILGGDLGTSMEWNKPVKEVIGDKIALTMTISIATLLLSWLLAVPIGIYSAVKQYSLLDYVFTFVGFIGIAIPNFLFALVLMYITYSVTGHSMSGLFSPGMQNHPWDWAKMMDLAAHMWIPIVIIGTGGTAGLIRVMRGNLLDELRKQYVVTAQAKGLQRIKLLLKYPVRVALNPFVSTVGWVLPALISGEVIVSMVMGLPTVGPTLLEALLNQDMYLAGSMIMILSALTVIGTLLSDLLLLWLDPRITYEGKAES
jgi:peptide/nickel transport system permease protein